MTRKTFEEAEADALSRADEIMVDRMVNSVREILSQAMKVEWRPHCVKQLGKAFASALEINRLLIAQQCEYRIEMETLMSAAGVKTFQTTSMADVNGIGDDSHLAGAPLTVSVFPGIYKVKEGSAAVTVVAKARMRTW
jgi:hypothetical protein